MKINLKNVSMSLIVAVTLAASGVVATGFATTAHAKDEKSAASVAAIAPRQNQADTNSDGVVTREEYLSLASKRAEARFKRLDKNGDGKITKEEFIKRMDRNGDGKISEDEKPKRQHRGEHGEDKQPAKDDSAAVKK